MRPIWPSDVISFEETGVLLSCLPDLGYGPRRLSQDRLASPEGSSQGLPFVSDAGEHPANGEGPIPGTRRRATQRSTSSSQNSQWLADVGGGSLMAFQIAH